MGVDPLSKLRHLLRQVRGWDTLDIPTDDFSQPLAAADPFEPAGRLGRMSDSVAQFL
jgi:hypothetical protein